MRLIMSQVLVSFLSRGECRRSWNREDGMGQFDDVILAYPSPITRVPGVSRITRTIEPKDCGVLIFSSWDCCKGIAFVISGRERQSPCSNPKRRRSTHH